jgi:hypothetical protein
MKKTLNKVKAVKRRTRSQGKYMSLAFSPDADAVNSSNPNARQNAPYLVPVEVEVESTFDQWSLYYKTFLRSFFMDFRNKLECFPLPSLSSLV